MANKRVIACFLVSACFIFVHVSSTQTSTGFVVTNEEVNTLVQDLLSIDENRARSNHFTMNYQHYSNSKVKNDSSREKLFSYVSPHLLRRPSYSYLIALFDNYFPHTGQAEVQTLQENTEIEQFLQTVFSTKVFNKTYQFLHSKNHPSARTIPQFQSLVRHLWFNFYSRQRGAADTSGFEHVFIGEVVRGETDVGGMHNWVRYHQLEEAGYINYSGYIVRRGTVIASIQYQWNNVWKSAGGFMIGTSPEFELSIYTLCFLTRPGFRQCEFQIDNCNVQITSHQLVQNGKTYIGTVFPSPGRVSVGCR